MLGTLPEKEKADWKSHLGSMTHAYNCTRHPSTTYSPYYLMLVDNLDYLLTMKWVCLLMCWEILVVKPGMYKS